MEVVVETAGEDTEQTDVLELIHDTWFEAGIKLFAKPSQREVFRSRVFSGHTNLSVWPGIENGLPTANMSRRNSPRLRSNSCNGRNGANTPKPTARAAKHPTIPLPSNSFA